MEKNNDKKIRQEYIRKVIAVLAEKGSFALIETTMTFGKNLDSNADFETLLSEVSDLCEEEKLFAEGKEVKKLLTEWSSKWNSN